jgi:GDP-L-fucose synthase
VDSDSRIYVAGHRGLAGSALFRSLHQKGYRNLITRTHAELDLEQQDAVDRFFSNERPQYVLLAAAKVGGICANVNFPVDFLLRNLRIEANIIEASWRHAVEGLLFLGSSCIYPRLAAQPLKEEYVLSGPLEPTNEPYAVAKIAGLELCEAYNRQYGTRFLSVMPTNLYGLNDNYDLENSHVLPAFIRKFHLAKLAAHGHWDAISADAAIFGPIPTDFYDTLTNPRIFGGSFSRTPAPDASNESSSPVVRLWGTGSPRREFLFSDDLADACIFLMNRLDDLFANHQLSAGTVLSAPGTPPLKSESPDSNSFAHHPRPVAEGSSLAARHLINIGYGEDLSIGELAKLVAGIVRFHGPVEWDSSKPDGTPQKLLDTTRIKNLGWRPKFSLEDGIRLTYQDYLLKGKS